MRSRARVTRPVRVTVVAPVNQPRHGYVVYSDTRHASARRRLDEDARPLRGAGVPPQGYVVESRPVRCAKDALTQLEPPPTRSSSRRTPPQQSGWLRRDVVEQIRRPRAELPVEHVVVAHAAIPRARRTCSSSRTRRCSARRCSTRIRARGRGRPGELPDRRRRRATRRRRQPRGRDAAPARRLRAAPRGDRRPRPGRASRSVHGDDGGDRTTSASTRSSSRRSRSAVGWLRRDLVARLRKRDRACRSSTSSSRRTAEVHCAEPLSRPADASTARASRAAAAALQLAGRSRSSLGMFLFIGSEIMLFGAFFTAYFFVRVVER